MIKSANSKLAVNAGEIALSTWVVFILFMQIKSSSNFSFSVLNNCGLMPFFFDLMMSSLLIDGISDFAALKNCVLASALIVRECIRVYYLLLMYCIEVFELLILLLSSNPAYLCFFPQRLMLLLAIYILLPASALG